MDRKFYSFNTAFRSLKDNLRRFLKESGIYYELSGCGAAWHFEIKCNPTEVELVNNWLDANTITCK
jgi:hypothetical protein